MIKKAVILAAGHGTRLQPLTYDLPKPMIPLLGKSVMEHIVEHLARQGVRENSFEGHIEHGQLTPEPVCSAGALRKIDDLGGFIDDTTAVLCEAGAHIERRVVFDCAQVGANATAREVIVSGSYCVSRDDQADDAPAIRWWGDARRQRHSLRGAA